MVNVQVCSSFPMHVAYPWLSDERMTKCFCLSLQAALGVTGVEGTFRLGAESALAALRASEGSLSTVLLSTLNTPSVELSSGHHMSAMHKASL